MEPPLPPSVRLRRRDGRPRLFGRSDGEGAAHPSWMWRGRSATISLLLLQSLRSESGHWLIHPAPSCLPPGVLPLADGIRRHFGGGGGQLAGLLLIRQICLSAVALLKAGWVALATGEREVKGARVVSAHGSRKWSSGLPERCPSAQHRHQTHNLQTRHAAPHVAS